MNSTTSTLPCNKLLFELGIPFRGNNTLLLNQGNQSSTTDSMMLACPDTIMVPIFSSILILIFLPILIFTLIVIFMKRKSGHIHSRGMFWMLSTLVAGSTHVFIPCLRWIIGRDIFPCGLFSFVAFNLCWAMSLPPMYACFTFVVRGRLFQLLTLKSSDSAPPDSLNSSNNPQIQKVVNDVISQEKDESSQSLKMQFTNSQKKLLIIYKFLLSNKFLLLIQVFLFSIHTIIWLILGMIEVFTPESFTRNYPTFGWRQFWTGCLTKPNTVPMYIAFYSLYGLVTIFFLVLVIIREKDTWGIKIETSITTTLMLICVILSFALPRIDILNQLVDYIIPIPVTLSFFAMCQVIILITIPAIRAMYYDRKKSSITESEEPSFYEKLLSHRETFNLILDFSRRSYSSEPVLCFETIENYRKSKNSTLRMKIATNILETFLNRNSAFELNIPKIEQLHQDLKCFIKEKNESKITDILDQLRTHCLLDMSEMMHRMTLEHPKLFIKTKQQDPIKISTIV